MRRMAFSFSMTPLMNSPSARRSAGGMKQREMNPNLCEAAWGSLDFLLESAEDRQHAYHESLHDTSVTGDLWLGGFMARIVIKPNSWLWRVISAAGYGNICWGSRELTLLSLSDMWREHRGGGFEGCCVHAFACVRCTSLTVVFLFEEGPQLVGSLLGRVLVLGELALLVLRDQLKYRLEIHGTKTNVYKTPKRVRGVWILCSCSSAVLLAFFPSKLLDMSICCILAQYEQVV